LRLAERVFPRRSLDEERRSDPRQLVEALDVAVLEPDAAVRRTARDEAGFARPVQADHAAARPVREGVGVGGRADGPRPVERVSADTESLPDPERPGRGRRARCSDTDGGPKADPAAVVERHAQRPAVDHQPRVHEMKRAERGAADPARHPVGPLRQTHVNPLDAVRVALTCQQEVDLGKAVLGQQPQPADAARPWQWSCARAAARHRVRPPRVGLLVGQLEALTGIAHRPTSARRRRRPGRRRGRCTQNERSERARERG